MWSLYLLTTVLFFCMQTVKNVELTEDFLRNLTIINGHEAIAHEAPYLAFIGTRSPEGTNYCGGVLISPQYVLTTAHCIRGATRASVKLGAHKILVREPSQIHFTRVSEMTPHEDFNCATKSNDIGLIKLPEKVSETPYIKYAKLPSRADADRSYIGKKGRAYGWGYSTSTAKFSKVLRYADLYITSNDKCEKMFPGQVSDKSICTKNADDAKIYYGDSGGPLVVGETVMGIIAFGSRDCAIASPSVLVNVAKYLDWIKTNSNIRID